MRTADHLNKFRNKAHPQFKTEDTDGMNGFFVIPLSKEDQTFALVLSGESNNEIKWEHVSARIGYTKYHGKLAERIPTWEEMCLLKDLFWGEDEVVMQLHPAKSEYVNDNPNVLHLWKPTDCKIPTPPKVCV